MTYSRFIAPLALAALLGATAVSAQSPPPPPQRPAGPSMKMGSPGQPDSSAPAFADLAKGKKFLSRGDLPSSEESLKKVRAHFNDYDSNHDGKLDQDEYNAAVSNSTATQQR